jgi:hypothetical protein
MKPHSPETAKQLWSIMRPYLQKYHPDKVVESQRMLQLASMAKPHTWYPLASGMQRHIIYHAGPTNSGKTYAALQVLLRIIVFSCPDPSQQWFSQQACVLRGHELMSQRSECKRQCRTHAQCKASLC